MFPKAGTTGPPTAPEGRLRPLCTRRQRCEAPPAEAWHWNRNKFGGFALAGTKTDLALAPSLHGWLCLLPSGFSNLDADVVWRHAWDFLNTPLANALSLCAMRSSSTWAHMFAIEVLHARAHTLYVCGTSILAVSRRSPPSSARPGRRSRPRRRKMRRKHQFSSESEQWAPASGQSSEGPPLPRHFVPAMRHPLIDLRPPVETDRSRPQDAPNA